MDRGELKRRFCQAKTEEEFVSLGVALFSPGWEGGGLAKALAEEWERRQHETPAESCRRKRDAFWWRATKPLRWGADVCCGLESLIAWIALIVAILALWHSLQ